MTEKLCDGCGAPEVDGVCTFFGAPHKTNPPRFERPSGHIRQTFVFATGPCECVDPETNDGRPDCEKCDGIGIVDYSGPFDVFVPHAYTDHGKRLRTARKAAGLTMGDAARALGVSVSTWSDLERGQAVPVDGDWGPVFAVVGVRP